MTHSTSATNEVTLAHLETIPARALEFLRGVATTAAARHALVAVGYNDAEHALGWALLLKASGHAVPIAPAGESDPSDVRARAALVALSSWYGPHLRMISAALARDHEVQGAFVTEGLAAATGADAVVAVATLLDRLHVLQHGPHAPRHAADDHAALAVVSTRGVTASERARLAALVESAKTLGSGADEHAPAGVDAAKHERDLRALYRWYHDWSATAHTQIKRRDYQIRLGIAERHKKPAAKPPADGSEGSGTG